MIRITLVIALFFLFSCAKDEEENPKDPVVVSSRGILVCNEGNFGWGNSSLSWIDIDKEVISTHIYEAGNSGNKLGDVCQSATYMNSKLYVVVNNSSKIEVLNPTDFSQLTTITGLNSPRFVNQINESKAYVSDLYSHTISILDLSKDEIVGKIITKGWTEEMLLFNDKMYVSSPNSSYLYILNTLTDKLEDSINIGFGVSSLVLDSDDDLWVLSGGSTVQNTSGFLKEINLKDKNIQTNISFPKDEIPSKLKINEAKDKLYYLNKGVWEFSTSQQVLNANVFIKQNESQLFYGLGIDYQTGELYVSDVKDYLQISSINKYSQEGDLLHSFKAGIISSYFLIKE